MRLKLKFMKIEDVIADRILYYCDINDLSINALANKCYITQSTIENLVIGKSKNPKLKTIIRICVGLNITLKDFFDTKNFEDFRIEDYFDGR